MGYVEFIKDNVATRIESGDVKFRSAGGFQWCDGCECYQPGIGGKEIRDVALESVLWLCAKCRK